MFLETFSADWNAAYVKSESVSIRPLCSDPVHRWSNFRIADQPPRTRSAAPDPTRLKASLATPEWNKRFGSRHVRGDYKTLARLNEAAGAADATSAILRT
jgi:hypothetical protein